MKKTKMKSLLKNSAFFTIGICVLFLTFSCSNTKSESIAAQGPALISIHLEGDSYTDEATVGNVPSPPRASGGAVNANNSGIHRSIVAFNRDFDLVAELSPVSSVKSSTVLKGAQKFSTVKNSDLSAGILYKLLVYAENGAYVTERDYIHGDEQKASALVLDGGSKYTFIVFSVNRTNINAEVEFADPNNKTLAGSRIRDLSGDEHTAMYDLLYFRKDMIVSGNDQNYLGIVLKHIFSQVTTTIDAGDTGYTIDGITGYFVPSYKYATISLADGNITRSSEMVNSQAVFGFLNTSVVESFNATINSNIQGTGYFQFTSLTIGPFTRTGSGLRFEGLSFTPGVKYNLKIKIVPTDIFLVHEGQPAARINGQIWMRHNLGANINLNPDAMSSLGSALHGNYYQFGRKEVVADGAASQYNGNWIFPNNASRNAWNSGTEMIPQKTNNDPCPSGYRVPSESEFNSLINATVASNSGNYVSGSYTVAKILTSKRNRNIKLTLANQGWIPGWNLANRYINERGINGHLWSSTSYDQLPITRFFKFDQNNARINMSEPTYNEARSTGHNVRCIATPVHQIEQEVLEESEKQWSFDL